MAASRSAGEREQRRAAEGNAPSLRAVLATRPLGLFLDFDGTISELAPTPEDAVLSPRAGTLLEELASRCHLAIVSGRTLAVLRRKVGLPNLIYVGAHGLATWIDGREEREAATAAYADLARQAIAELASLRHLPGLLFEEKESGVALHFRLAEQPDAVRAEILRAVAGSPAAAQFELLEGIKMVELRPGGEGNKGAAVRRLAQRLGLGGLIYAGDDLTDLDAFAAVRDLREQGLAGLSVAVRNGQASPAVAAAADRVVDGVQGVEALLEAALQALTMPAA